jgi:hypothetical protein
MRTQQQTKNVGQPLRTNFEIIALWEMVGFRNVTKTNREGSGKSQPAVVSEFGDNRFVGDDWIQESDEDRPGGESGTQAIQNSPKTTFVGDSWMPASEEDDPASQPASESSPLSSPLTQLAIDKIHELAQKWIAESEEYTPAVDAGSAKRFIGEKWLPSSDEDTLGSQFAGDENSPSSPVSIGFQQTISTCQVLPVMLLQVPGYVLVMKIFQHQLHPHKLI